MQFALSRAAAIIAVSSNLRDFAINEGAAADRVWTIPNGVDTNIFFPRDRERVRRHHRISDGEQLIVSAGELIEAKGHHLVIQSIRRLVDEGYTVRLIIAGKTARGGACYETSLRQLVANLGLISHVQFAGWVDRSGLADLFSAADVFCLASYMEGWPNVVHEALSCGTPVVVSDVGGVRALVSNVQYGFIVPAKDVDPLYRALGEGLRRHWNRNAIAAWGQFRNWDQVASEVMAVFEQILTPPTVEQPDRSCHILSTRI
jgi:glycosyltransferase involved in cell wall biosynthesis